MMRTCTVLLPAACVLLAACATPRGDVDGALPAPPGDGTTADRVVIEVPEVPGGRLVARAPNSTVRPAHRAFSPDLLERLVVPPGFRIDVFAEGLEGPRGMVIGPDGALDVAERSAGRVRRLGDTNRDGRADESRIVLDGLRSGSGGVHDLMLHGTHMYLVTELELMRAEVRSDGSLGPVTQLQEIPAGGQHPNRSLGRSPDGTIFLSIGSTCNACVEPQEDHAALHRVSTD